MKTATMAELSTRVRVVLGMALVTALISTGTFAPVRANGQEIQPEAAGDLDPSFGTGGKVTNNFPQTIQTAANAIAIQGDGKLVVAAGVQFSASFAFGLARYNPDGSLDTSFGSGGGLAISFFGVDDRAFAVALQTDGKIIVGGWATTATKGADFGLARCNPDGTLDTSFGSGGKATTDFNGKDDIISAIVIMPDGKIAAAGVETNSDGSSSAALAIYNPDGSLVMKGSLPPVLPTMANAMVLQPDGKLVLGGSVTQGSRDSFALVRLNSDGHSDSSFGNGTGAAITDFGGNDDASSIALQPDGKIVAAGATRGGGTAEFALARYNTDGSPDSSFGSSGKVIADSVPKPAAATAVLIQPDGKIVAVGHSFGAAGMDFAVVRYNTDGSLDSSFGSNGQVATDFFGNDDGARAAAIQPDGKIVAAGFTTHSAGGPKSVALARYQSGAAPDFLFNFDQPMITTTAGAGKILVKLNISGTGGFTGNVTITAPAATPRGIRLVGLDPTTTTTPGVLSFRIKVKGNAESGTDTLTFTATDATGKLVHTATLTLVVQ